MRISEYKKVDGKMQFVSQDMTEEEDQYYTIVEDKGLQIDELKNQLAKTDYKAIKYAEGWYTDEEYAPIKAERETLRERIRELKNAED